MPDNDSTADLTHRPPGRILGDVDEGYLPPVTLHERVASGQLAALLTPGADIGPVRALVGRLEHQVDGWQVDPWRLIEQTAARLLDDSD